VHMYNRYHRGKVGNPACLPEGVAAIITSLPVTAAQETVCAWLSIDLPADYPSQHVSTITFDRPQAPSM
jgi:hypothetical protein